MCCGADEDVSETHRGEASGMMYTFVYIQFPYF